MNGHPNPRFARDRSDVQVFQHSSYNASTHQREPFETMQMIEEVSEHVGMNYPEVLDSRYVAQPVDDILFPW